MNVIICLYICGLKSFNYGNVQSNGVSKERYNRNNNSGIQHIQLGTSSSSKNVFASKELAEAAVALAQLSQLRQIYRQGWEPNWEDDSLNFVIDKCKEEVTGDVYHYMNHFLAFQSGEVRDKFLHNFKDLIETASPLLFG